MKKRLLAAVMVAVTLLSGCGGGGNPSSSSSETPSSSSQEEVKVIRVGMDGETPGFSSLDENGEMVGLDVDIWKEIGKRTGYEIQFERMEYSSLFSLLDDGRLDTVANEISVTESGRRATTSPIPPTLTGSPSSPGRIRKSAIPKTWTA